MNHAIALSAAETEQVRDLRNRLGRRAVSAAAQATLGNAFLQLCGRVGIVVDEGAPEMTPAEIVRTAADADMAALGRLAGALKRLKTRAPEAWPAAVALGAPQAVLSRRLALAGREPAVEA